MRKGFTILELLVASLLLGMLVTILSMIFNQSSIAWNVGVASAQKMDNVRRNLSDVREQADNILFHGTKQCLVTSLWKADGSLRKRAVVEGTTDSESGAFSQSISVSADTTSGSTGNLGTPIAQKQRTSYVVGVTSCGPDGKEKGMDGGKNAAWDNITNLPDSLF